MNQVAKWSALGMFLGVAGVLAVTAAAPPGDPVHFVNVVERERVGWELGPTDTTAAVALEPVILAHGAVGAQPAISVQAFGPPGVGLVSQPTVAAVAPGMAKVGVTLQFTGLPVNVASFDVEVAVKYGVGSLNQFGARQVAVMFRRNIEPPRPAWIRLGVTGTSEFFMVAEFTNFSAETQTFRMASISDEMGNLVDPALIGIEMITTNGVFEIGEPYTILAGRTVAFRMSSLTGQMIVGTAKLIREGGGGATRDAIHGRFTTEEKFDDTTKVVSVFEVKF